jgi:hypothetical protein
MGAKAMQSAMGEMTQNWLMAHPILSWGVAHPLWALGVVVALVFMSGGLLRAIAQLTEQLWIDLLQLPMRAIRWGLERLFPWRKPQPSAQNSVPVGFYKQTIKQDQTGSQSASNEQLCEIMVRLEQIQQEQSLLLQDIKALLLKEQTLAIRKKQIFLNESPPKK